MQKKAKILLAIQALQRKARHDWQKARLEMSHYEICEFKSQKLYPFYILREIVFLSCIM